MSRAGGDKSVIGRAVVEVTASNDTKKGLDSAQADVQKVAQEISSKPADATKSVFDATQAGIKATSATARISLGDIGSGILNISAGLKDGLKAARGALGPIAAIGTAVIGIAAAWADALAAQARHTEELERTASKLTKEFKIDPYIQQLDEAERKQRSLGLRAGQALDEIRKKQRSLENPGFISNAMDAFGLQVARSALGLKTRNEMIAEGAAATKDAEREVLAGLENQAEYAKRAEEAAVSARVAAINEEAKQAEIGAMNESERAVAIFNEKQDRIVSLRDRATTKEEQDALDRLERAAIAEYDNTVKTLAARAALEEKAAREREEKEKRAAEKLAAAITKAFRDAIQDAGDSGSTSAGFGNANLSSAILLEEVKRLRRNSDSQRGYAELAGPPL